MIGSNLPRIGVISMVRNDSFFVPRWIKYYSKHLGSENLFLILDGHDQPLPEGHQQINIIRLPWVELSRSKGDRNRAAIVSSLAKSLFQRFDIIIAHDIDEFLVVDPNSGMSFSEYFQRPIRRASISALGLDVGQHLESELPIELSLPFLEQRSFAHVSARYTKAVVACKPVEWGSGFHRVRGKNLHIDPNLYLFHFGMVDYAKSTEKVDDQSLLKAGWKGHFDRRYELFDLITKKVSIDGDDFFKRARFRQNLYRPLYAWNKPGMLKEKPIIRIPERFRSII